MKRMIILFLASCMAANGARAGSQAQASQDKPEGGKTAKSQGRTAPSTQNSPIDPRYRSGLRMCSRLTCGKEPELTHCRSLCGQMERSRYHS